MDYLVGPTPDLSPCCRALPPPTLGPFSLAGHALFGTNSN